MPDDAMKDKNVFSQLICFKLAEEEFGIDILKVKEIVPLQVITHLPQTPESVAGVINLRGEIIPVIDLRLKFGIDQIKMTDKTRIIVVSIKDRWVGIVVDRVERVARIKDEQFEPPPDIGVGEIQDYVIHLAKLEQSLVIVIDIEKILTEEEILHIEDVRKMKESLDQQESREEACRKETDSSRNKEKRKVVSADSRAKRPIRKSKP
ncbi:MAG TPA: purine-binding chemotaxis protein CheW [bacterium]|nr:purine-binding chemotaxis protein CheW [bacterium]